MGMLGNLWKSFENSRKLVGSTLYDYGQKHSAIFTSPSAHHIASLVITAATLRLRFLLQLLLLMLLPWTWAVLWLALIFSRDTIASTLSVAMCATVPIVSLIISTTSTTITRVTTTHLITTTTASITIVVCVAPSAQPLREPAGAPLAGSPRCGARLEEVG